MYTNPVYTNFPGFNGPSSFAIDSTTGIITTSGIIDYESLHVRYLVVKAVDAGATPLSSTCLVRITIVDLNDNSPVIVPDDFTVTVAEDATIGTLACRAPPFENRCNRR